MATVAVARSAWASGSPGLTITSRPSRSSMRLRTVMEPGITEVSDIAISSQNRREDLIETFSCERLDDEEGRPGRLRLLLHLGGALRGDEAELHVVAVGPQLA